MSANIFFKFIKANKSGFLNSKTVTTIIPISNLKYIEYEHTTNKTSFYFNNYHLEIIPENKDYDVLKMNIKSEKLNELNKLASTLPHTSTYPDYKPHITVAYLTKGNGNNYVDLNFKMKINTIDKIVYSKSNGEKIDIPLI